MCLDGSKAISMWKGFFESLSCEVRALFGIRNVYIMLNKTAVYTKSSSLSIVSNFPSTQNISPSLSSSFSSSIILRVCCNSHHPRTRRAICPLRPPHPRSRSAPSLSSLLHVAGSGYPFPMIPHPSLCLFILSGGRVWIHGTWSHGRPVPAFRQAAG